MMRVPERKVWSTGRRIIGAMLLILEGMWLFPATFEVWFTLRGDEGILPIVSAILLSSFIPLGTASILLPRLVGRIVAVLVVYPTVVFIVGPTLKHLHLTIYFLLVYVTMPAFSSYLLLSGSRPLQSEP